MNPTRRQPSDRTMSNRLVFRLATPEDDPKILDLFRASFGRNMRADWWNWFNHQCPTGRNRTAVIEDLDKKRLAGSYSLLPIRLWMNGREMKASLCTNVNTHPEYRQLGLFTKIGEYALGREEDFSTPISLGMPNQYALPGHMKVGWEVPFMLPFLVKYGCTARSHRCKEVSGFDERFDEFFDQVRKAFSFIVLKDHLFVNWRVVNRPDQRYTKLVYEDDSELQGYIILKHFDEGSYRKSHILDIQATTDEALHELLAAAEGFAQGRDELNVWTNPRNPYQRAFLDEGFVERDSPDRLILHTNYGNREAINEGAWWFCLADNDVY